MLMIVFGSIIAILDDRRLRDFVLFRPFVQEKSSQKIHSNHYKIFSVFSLVK
jgi:hypothetical protein